MHNRRNIGAVVDGSFEGLMTVVYQYYYEKICPVEIVGSGKFQQSLLTDYVIVQTDHEKAGRVINALAAKMPEEALQHIYNAFLSFEEAKYLNIFKYIIAGFYYRGDIDKYESLDYVLAVHKLSKNVLNEGHLMKEFVRFTKISGGVLYSDISPKNNVLPILAEHFSDRLCDERFIIHDVPRKLAVVYNAKEWVLTDTPGSVSFDLDKDEIKFQELWTLFYNTVAIKERINKNLRRSHMPNRYWRHMTEHKAYWGD